MQHERPKTASINMCTMVAALLLLTAAVSAKGETESAWPVPTALPPHSWATVGNRVFIHGCKSSGLFNTSELALAARFPLLTVEKGQGEELPGYAEDKMAALAAQWHTASPRGWAIFYMNAHFNWGMYRMSKAVDSEPALWVRNSSGQACRGHGDPTFPQPTDGMLLFNMSNPDMRAIFVATAVNATRSGGRFSGVFVDGADSWGTAALAKLHSNRRPGTATRPFCDMSAASMADLARGNELLLIELQAALGSSRLIIAKDGGHFYNDSEYCNTEFLSDSFCSCYHCDVNAAALAETCNLQLQAAILAGTRGQVALMHGEVNTDASAGSLQQQFTFTLAAFLIAAADSSFFGFSDGWYFNGTRWHPEYDLPLGAPRGPAHFAGGVWTREFAHAAVRLDVAEHTANFTWGEDLNPHWSL